LDMSEEAIWSARSANLAM